MSDVVYSTISEQQKQIASYPYIGVYFKRSHIKCCVFRLLRSSVSMPDNVLGTDVGTLQHFIREQTSNSRTQKCQDQQCVVLLILASLARIPSSQEPHGISEGQQLPLSRFIWSIPDCGSQVMSLQAAGRDKTSLISCFT